MEILLRLRDIRNSNNTLSLNGRNSVEKIFQKYSKILASVVTVETILQIDIHM